MFKVYGSISIFFHHVFKGRQFPLLPICLPGGPSLPKMGANAIFYMTPIHIGGNNENDRVASPDTVPIPLKFWDTCIVIGKGNYGFRGLKLCFTLKHQESHKNQGPVVQN